MTTKEDIYNSEDNSSFKQPSFIIYVSVLVLLHVLAFATGAVKIILDTVNTTPLAAMICKPIPVYCAIGVVITNFLFYKKECNYRHVIVQLILVCVGLLFCSFGDLFLDVEGTVNSFDKTIFTPESILPTVIFALGILAFAIGHILFIIAFSFKGNLRIQQTTSNANTEMSEMNLPKLESNPTSDTFAKTNPFVFHVYFDFLRPLLYNIHWFLGLGFFISVVTILLKSKDVSAGILAGLFIYVFILIIFVWRMSETVRNYTIRFAIEPLKENNSIVPVSHIVRQYEVRNTLLSHNVLILLQYIRFAGAFLFLFSDTWIGLNKFKAVELPTGASPYLITLTYYLSIYCVAWSTLEYNLAPKYLLKSWKEISSKFRINTITSVPSTPSITSPKLD
ncbi:hypothetical protein ABK040_009017 [Willaertia magna]